MAIAQQGGGPSPAGDYTVAGTITSYSIFGDGSASSYTLDTDGDGVGDKTIDVACQPNSMASSLRAWKDAGTTVTFSDENGDDGTHHCGDTLTE